MVPAMRPPRLCQPTSGSDSVRSRGGCGARLLGRLSFAARSKLLEDSGQAAALDELHRVVVNSVIAADSKYRHDMRVMQLRGRLGLDLESLPLFGVDRRGERKHLQGDAAAQRDLLGFIDDPHATPTHLAENAVVTQLVGGRWHRKVGAAKTLRPPSCAAPPG